MPRACQSFRRVVVAVGVLCGVGVAVGGCATPAKPPPPDPRVVAAQLETRRAEAQALAPTLQAPSAAARARAVLALARLERHDAIPGVLVALADGDALVRATAAFAAGQIDLALDPRRPTHEQRRVEVESALVARLPQEREPAVRLALLRALGRVAARDGLKTLTDTAAQGSVDERATALVALGVAGARRKASLSRDDVVRGVVDAALRAAEPAVTEGAAYAAFRQRLPVSAEAIAAARVSPSPQARIFVARALPFVAVDIAVPALAALLRDEDWRVRVEAARTVAARQDVPLGNLVDALGRAVARATQPGEQHVVGEVCAALAVVGAPAEATPAVMAAVAALPAGADEARCGCAGALDVLGGGDDALLFCTASPAARARHVVDAIARRRMAATERLAQLQTFVDDDEVPIRITAAAAVCGIGGVEAADVAATRLLREDDPGVAGALLECFADDAHADVLRDATIAAAAARFTDASAPEAREPLLALAALTRGRPGLEELTARLKVHRDPRVRDVAADVPAGERAPGPRAMGDAPPVPATLPLGAVLQTSRGAIKIAFERELAPVAVQTFVALARKGAYRGTPLHRVIAGFVAQGGDPRGDGSGGPGFFIPCENSDAPFTRGAVGIATAGKDTGGSQFFLVHSWQPHLDGRFTLFARVVDGLAVMDALQRDDVVFDIDVVTALRKTH